MEFTRPSICMRKWLNVLGANGALVKEWISLCLRLYANLVEFFMGTNGTLVKEWISLGLQIYDKLVECLWVQMVPLSRNGLH